MAYHTIGQLRRRAYTASCHSSATAAALAVHNRCKLEKVYQAAKISQTASAGSWTVSLDGSQVTGLSSVAVSSGVAGVQVTSASPTANTYVAAGSVLSVVGSSLTASNWTFVVQEF